MDARSSRYHEVYAHWQRSPEVFWAEAAADIDWYEKPKKIFDPSAGILYSRTSRPGSYSIVGSSDPTGITSRISSPSITACTSA